MKFNPLSEEEIQTQSLAPEGCYRYKVHLAEEKISKAQNEYISLVLKIWDEDGREYVIFTNLALMKLLKHFCDMNSLQENYEAGNVSDEMCKGKTGGRVMVAIEAEKPDGKGGMYPAKNVVRDYVVAPQGSKMKPLPDIEAYPFDDESIPF